MSGGGGVASCISGSEIQFFLWSTYLAVRFVFTLLISSFRLFLLFPVLGVSFSSLISPSSLLLLLPLSLSLSRLSHSDFCVGIFFLWQPHGPGAVGWFSQSDLLLLLSPGVLRVPLFMLLSFLDGDYGTTPTVYMRDPVTCLWCGPLWSPTQISGNTSLMKAVSRSLWWGLIPDCSFSFFVTALCRLKATFLACTLQGPKTPPFWDFLVWIPDTSTPVYHSGFSSLASWLMQRLPSVRVTPRSPEP